MTEIQSFFRCLANEPCRFHDNVPPPAVCPVKPAHGRTSGNKIEQKSLATRQPIVRRRMRIRQLIDLLYRQINDKKTM